MNRTFRQLMKMFCFVSGMLIIGCLLRNVPVIDIMGTNIENKWPADYIWSWFFRKGKQIKSHELCLIKNKFNIVH